MTETTGPRELTGDDFRAADAGSMTGAEWEARVDLAAMYRLSAHFGYDDTVWNHITMRVPGTEHDFFLNKFGLLYDEVTASNLIKVDSDGTVLEGPKNTVIVVAEKEATVGPNLALGRPTQQSSLWSGQACDLEGHIHIAEEGGGDEISWDIDGGTRAGPYGGDAAARTIIRAVSLAAGTHYFNAHDAFGDGWQGGYWEIKSAGTWQTWLEEGPSPPRLVVTIHLTLNIMLI